MANKKIVRMTLDDIIQAKIKRDQDKLTVKEIEIPSIGKSLQFRRPTRSEICEFMDGVQDAEENMEVLLELYQDIIYMCCEDLHDKNLLETAGVANPVMIVPAIMDDADICKVGDEVASLNPLYQDYADEEKNS